MMPKRRTEETTVIRYQQKAYAIAKGLGLDDELAKAKANAQTSAWVRGRSGYGKLARYVREHLIMETEVKPAFFGQIISMANWLYKEVAIRKTMDFETAWSVAMKRWGLEMTLAKKDLDAVKNILKTYISPSSE